MKSIYVIGMFVIVLVLSPLIVGGIVLAGAPDFIGSTSNYSVVGSFTETYIRLDGDTLWFSGRNMTVHDSATVGLDSWSTTYLNFTTNESLNITVCGFSTNRDYSVYSDSTVVYSNISIQDINCLVFNITGVVFVTVNSTSVPIEEVNYSIYNGTYTTANNQSLPLFYCYPLQTSCYPYAQTSTQWVMNWSNNGASDLDVYLTVNETGLGWELYANLGSDNYSASTNLTTTSQVNIGSVEAGTDGQIWLYINTFYPFDDWIATVKMEVQ